MTASLVPQMILDSFCDNLDHQSLYPTFDNFVQKQEQENSYDPVSDAIYTDLSLIEGNGKRIKKECLETENNLSSWKHTHPENWTNKEVLDWVYFIADDPQYCFDCEKFKGEVFQNLAGRQLCCMSRDDFLERDAEHGEIFYELLKSLLEGVVLSEPSEPTLTEAWASLETMVCDGYRQKLALLPQPQKMDCRENSCFTDIADTLPIDYTLMVEDDSIHVSVDEGHTWYDIDPTISQFEVNFSDQGYSSGGSECGNKSPSAVSDVSSTESLTTDLPCFQNDDIVPKSENQTWKSCSSAKRPSKGTHLWEFIRDLLKDPETTPSLLRWEDRENGVFKFMQSEQVAKKWGKKKNNPNMTYEKLSRAMRFCRTAGYFAEVPKTGKFPKKLCFKFGPKSYGWQTERDDITTRKESWRE